MIDEQLSLACQAMGLPPPASARLLAGSASGSGVYRISEGAGDVVLKVTTAAAWRRQARHELTWYRDLDGRLPVAMPRLIGWTDTDAVTAMVLSAHRPAPPAASWAESDWLQFATELGTLHTASPRLVPTASAPGSSVVPGPRGGMAWNYWLTTDAATVAAAVFEEGPALQGVLEQSPECLVHGDCHVGNVLLAEDGSFVWADWQEVGVGHGESDLAFLWMRAEIDAGQVPRAAMLDRYVTARGADPDVSERAVLAAELAIIAFAWPEYAGWNDQAARDRVTRRLITLAQAWG